jgi:hypothetical protein
LGGLILIDITIFFFFYFFENDVTIQYTKGQLISKADWRTIDSPKKRTDEFILFAFLLFTAKPFDPPYVRRFRKTVFFLKIILGQVRKYD